MALEVPEIQEFEQTRSRHLKKQNKNMANIDFVQQHAFSQNNLPFSLSSGAFAPSNAVATSASFFKYHLTWAIDVHVNGFVVTF